MNCTCEWLSVTSRRPDPLCLVHRPLEDIIEEALRPLVEEARGKIYTPEFAAGKSEAEILGVIVAKFLKWDGNEILVAAAEALEDANFDAEAAKVKELLMAVGSC